MAQHEPVWLPTAGRVALDRPGLDPGDPCNTWPYVDRRRVPDRRRHPTRWWDSFLGRKRRVRGRRKGEVRNVYVDVYYHADLALIVVIFLLNLADAALTLDYLGRGGGEGNPVMAQFLALGPNAFVLEKCFAVGLCLLALAVHKTFLLARVSIYGLLLAYGALTAYHAFLQIQIRFA